MKQSIAAIPDFDSRCRRIFEFLPGLRFDIFWDEWRQMWVGKAYTLTEIGGWRIAGDTTDLSPWLDLARRRDVPKHLRRAIAERKNPGIAAVNKKILT